MIYSPSHFLPSISSSSLSGSTSSVVDYTMVGKDRRLRLVSPERTQSDGNSSVQANETSSQRAQSTTPQPRTQSPEPSSPAATRPTAQAQTLPLRTRSSMEDDLRGLSSPVDLHGVKRPRADLWDAGDSDDEPAPKRDKLLEELCNLQSSDHPGPYLAGPEDTKDEEAMPVRPHRIRPLENRDLPLRSRREADRSPSSEEQNQPHEPKGTPALAVSNCETKEDAESISRRHSMPPTRP